MVTGSRGIHVVVPLKRTRDVGDVQAWARAFAAELADQHPDSLTTEFHKIKRNDRLYLDVARNGPAQTVVPPYAPRPRPGAPVATPLQWDELEDPALRPRRLDTANHPRPPLRPRRRPLGGDCQGSASTAKGLSRQNLTRPGDPHVAPRTSALSRSVITVDNRCMATLPRFASSPGCTESRPPHLPRLRSTPSPDPKAAAARRLRAQDQARRTTSIAPPSWPRARLSRWRLVVDQTYRSSSTAHGRSWRHDDPVVHITRPSATVLRSMEPGAKTSDRTEFVLDEDVWKAFVATLDREAEVKPAILKLMRRPRPE